MQGQYDFLNIQHGGRTLTMARRGMQASQMLKDNTGISPLLSDVKMPRMDVAGRKANFVRPARNFYATATWLIVSHIPRTSVNIVSKYPIFIRKIEEWRGWPYICIADRGDRLGNPYVQKIFSRPRNWTSSLHRRRLGRPHHHAPAGHQRGGRCESHLCLRRRG